MERQRALLIGLVVLNGLPLRPGPAFGSGAPTAAPPIPCGPAVALPAYAHNDYRNRRPREDALGLGYRGLEIDVFLVDGTFLVAHDREDVRAGFSLEADYLQPLRERMRRCGRIQPDPRPFLLTIEDKAPTPTSRLALATVLARFPELTTDSPEGAIAVIVLVDDQATPASVPEELRRQAGLQWPVNARDPVPPVASAADYRLLSLDYDRVIDWDGEGPPPPAARALLATVVAAARARPGCLVRAHHVPARARIWNWLLDAGVDLIGVTDLRRGSRLLEPRAACAPKDGTGPATAGAHPSCEER